MFENAVPFLLLASPKAQNQKSDRAEDHVARTIAAFHVFFCDLATSADRLRLASAP